MTIGVGGKTEAEALAALSDMTAGAKPIGESEYRARIAKGTPFFLSNKTRVLGNRYDFFDASEIPRTCRMQKSPAELALMQCAKDMTLKVQQAAASILRTGISTTEVESFIEQAHRKVGAPGSTFCIVLFGP